MSLGINEETQDRDLVELQWDPADFEGEVMIVATNPDSTADDSDISNKTSQDDGSATFTYPTGYSGRTLYTVTDDSGNSQSVLVVLEDGAVVSTSEVEGALEDEGENEE